jgi:polyhydroxyalkanoate synthesis regulator phasin
MNNVVSLKRLIAFLLVVFYIQDSTLAQQNKIDTLQTKVEKLQQKVTQLESKIAEVEEVLIEEVLVPREQKKILEEILPPSSRDTINSEKWRNKQNWRKLEKGMSEEEVKKILGEPSRIKSIPSVEMWNYGSGDVEFSDGEVRGWSEPLL